MNFVSLLSTTVRLLDLHDSQRAYGAMPSYTEESRSGHNDGFYLGIAIDIIKLLYELDQTTSHDYLPFNSIFNTVKSKRSNVIEDDVMYVLNVIRRPTELWYQSENDFSLLSEKKRTALIEKTDYADEYRLSGSGRAAVILSREANGATYIRGDAYNLLHAIEFGEYSKTQQFADELIRQLRDEILDIRAAIEKVGKTDTADKYIDNFERYKKVIQDTLEIINKAESAFSNIDTLDSFNAWQDKANSDLTYESIVGLLNRVRQTLEVLNRAVQELVTSTIKDGRSSIKPPSFLNFAFQQVISPEKLQTIDFIINKWGALNLATNIHSPLDGYSVVKVKDQKTDSVCMEFDINNIEPVTRVGKLEFMEQHGKAISEALKAAPLRLSDAINNGWFILDDKVMLGDLIGVFVSPESLSIKGHLQIKLLDKINISDVTTGKLFYTDLEISILNEAPE